MTSKKNVFKGGFLLGLIALAMSACGGPEPSDGYFDRDHHRYYREHAWHECAEHDDHCR
jgi:hypothetical protein